MLLVNEISVTVAGRCWKCDGRLDCADVPWLECEPCGMAWLVGEIIVEHIDLPDAIKGVACQHDQVTVVMWDGTRTVIGEDEPIPSDARSVEFMFERRSPGAGLGTRR